MAPGARALAHLHAPRSAYFLGEEFDAEAPPFEALCPPEEGRIAAGAGGRV
jgi:hypothetical protein